MCSNSEAESRTWHEKPFSVQRYEAGEGLQLQSLSLMESLQHQLHLVCCLWPFPNKEAFELKLYGQYRGRFDVFICYSTDLLVLQDVCLGEDLSCEELCGRARVKALRG